MEKKRDSSDSSRPVSELNTEESGAVPSKKHEVLIMNYYLHCPILYRSTTLSIINQKDILISLFRMRL